MTSIWVESLGRAFDAALDLLAAAVRDWLFAKMLILRSLLEEKEG